MLAIAHEEACFPPQKLLLQLAGFPVRVIFINRYFHPDLSATSEMLSGLVFALSKRGVPVTVITSRLRYEDGKNLYLPTEAIDGLKVRRVWTSRLGRTLTLGRTIDYLSFLFAAAWELWRLTRPGDIIVAKTDPPLLSMMVAPIARLKGAKLVNWLQDIFPEVAEALDFGGRLARPAFRLIQPFRNWSLRVAGMNVVVGEGMAARLRALGVSRENLSVIQNWSNGALVAPIEPTQNALRASWAPKGRFVIAYAGNLGRAHDIDTLIEAMTILHKRATNSPAQDIAHQILFIFVGGGAQRARLEREVLQRRLTNVRLHPYQPRERLSETLGVADLHLVSLNPKLEGLVVPSKFYSIAAAGRPTLFIGAPDGEIARLITDANCGVTVRPGDAEALVDHIVQLAEDPQLCTDMGARARAAFEEHWSKDRAVEQWEDVLKAVADCSAPKPTGYPPQK
jgi:glycosyltransferase involved in cell wall biosynthesis